MSAPLTGRKAAAAAGTATFYILVTGITVIILMPIFFLVSISMMSDSEAYDEWPLPLLPSSSARFTIESTAKGHLISVYSRAKDRYVPLFASTDPEDISNFVAKKTNCRLTVEELNRHISTLSQQDKASFRLRKNLLANYTTFFRVSDDTLPAVFRSIKTALATIFISLVIGGMGGYAFARYSFAGRNSIRLGVLFVRIFPAIAIAMPMVIILGRMGLYDRPLGLALVYAVGQIALTVWITASIFMSIPVEMEEAAQVFGTTKVGSFFRITLPLALPGLAACAMYAFIGSWNETIQAIVLTQSNPTFPVVVYQTLVGSKGMVNLAAAGAVAMALPAVVFTLIIRKYVLRMWGGVRV